MHEIEKMWARTGFSHFTLLNVHHMEEDISNTMTYQLGRKYDVFMIDKISVHIIHRVRTVIILFSTAGTVRRFYDESSLI